MPKLEKRKITDFQPDPANANAGTERGLRVLDDSLAETGLGRSIVADKNGIVIAGNKTQQAAVDRGFEDAVVVHTTGDTLVVVQRDDLDLADPTGAARKLAYYDNRAGQLGLEWSAAQIAADVAAGLDLSALWQPDELAAILDGVVTVDPPADAGAQVDRADELQREWQTERGQVWAIPSKAARGVHRVLCGDSTNADDVARVMAGERAKLVIADPPYGMKLDTDYSQMPNTTVRGKHYTPVIGDDAVFDFAPYTSIECQEQFWWGADYYCQQLPRGGSWLVWDKRIESNDAVIGSGFELCWSKSPHQRRLLRYLWSGFTARDPNEQRTHPTQKPIAVYAEIITNHSKQNDPTYDPFGGSGTTMVACEQLGRLCRMIEIEPKYCAVILQRMHDLGLEPRLVEQHDDAQ